MHLFLRLKGNGLAEAVMLKIIRMLILAQTANLNVFVLCQLALCRSDHER
jgi:hypothetical protein